MKLTRIGSIALAASALVVLSACSGGSGGTGGDEKPMLGLVQFSGDDVYSNSAINGAAAYAESQGWETQIVDAKGSVDGANAAMVNLVTKGADALFTTVFPNAALGEGIAAAQDAGIPIANWGGGLGDGVPIAADTALGDAIATKVVDDMAGAGELLVLGYNPGLPCQLREASLDKALEGTTINPTRQQITIPGQVQSVYDATTAWAAAHPEGSASSLAVWSCFDDPATGAAAAVADLGRTDIKTYGLNGTAEAIKLVKEGTLTATLWINGAAQGEELAKMIIQYLDDPAAFEPTEIGGENIVVDSSNVDSFIADHPEFQ